MSKVHGKWTQVSRTKITSSIAKKAIKIENQVDETLQAITHLCTTADIWSDRVMRGYLGITVHGLSVEKDQLTLKSYLLTCTRYVTNDNTIFV